MDWIFKGRPLSSKPPKDSSYGFVYLLTLNDGTFYIGRKEFWSREVLPALAGGIRACAIRVNRRILRGSDGKIIVSKKDKAKARAEGLKAKLEPYDEVVNESKWRSYNGSCKEVKAKDVVKKEILFIAKSKLQLTYFENRELYSRRVLETDEYRNDNIGGKIFGDKI